MIKNTIAMMLIIATAGTTIANVKVNLNQEKNVAVASTRNVATYLTARDKFILTTKQFSEQIELEKVKIQEMINEKQAEIDAVKADNNRKNSVTFNPYDLTQKSGISTDGLYQVLSKFNGGSLAKFAWVFKDCEDTYNINAFFLAGLVAQESGWGSSHRAKYQNNLTGHAVYNDSAVGTTFNSQEESIYSTAKMLAKNYLTQGGKNYHGTSIWNVNTDYCLYQDGSATDYKWSDNISSIAADFNSYYHNNIKTLKKVPVMDIDMDNMIQEKQRELLDELANN